jgi:hypothetical protein
MNSRPLWLVFLGLLSFGCSSSSGEANPEAGSSSDAGAPDSRGPHDAAPPEASVAEAASSVKHTITAKIVLEKDPDGEHVSFPTQNGSTVAMAVSDLVGKTVYWATAPGGEPISNVVKPIDQGITTLSSDLTSTFATAAHYADGPFEVACVISVTGTPPPNIPAAGDLAAFDNSPPRKGDPPVTGDSVRVDVDGANATLTLDNREFIRFGTK